MFTFIFELSLHNSIHWTVQEFLKVRYIKTLISVLNNFIGRVVEQNYKLQKINVSYVFETCFPPILWIVADNHVLDNLLKWV